MADRRRRNVPEAVPDAGRRRRRGGDPPPEQARRRRRGPDDAGDPGEPASQADDPQQRQPQRSTPVAIEVTLPQLGESVTEGTITAWLVSVGDRVEADQPLFELSSDKIDTEVPAPASGVLTEIKVEVDETVDVGTVVAIIGEGDEAGGDGQAAADDGGGEAQQAEPEESEDSGGDAEAAGSVAEREDVAREAGGDAAAQDADTEEEPSAPAEATQGPELDEGADEQPSGDGAGVLSSPLVRRLAAENDIDLSGVRGSGEGGRVTREDIESAIAGKSAPAAAEQRPAAAQDQPAEKAKPAAAQPERRPAQAGGARTRVEDLSRIRQRIAAKMMESLQSSAQLTTVQEADLTRIMTLRERVKDEFKQREGVSLSPFVFLCRAAVLAIRNHPRINALADWNAGKVTFHEYVNLGIAVDTQKGLIVPNVKGADDLSLAGLARAIKTAADKARGQGKLEMDDIQGATFTMTNTGSVGVLIDTPILNYPEVAILGTGAVKKRPVVIEDDGGMPAIAIRDMCYLSLTYDHRLIDGADAARFVTEVKTVAETHDWAQEIGY